MKKNGKYCSKKSMNMKPLAVLLAMVLLVGCAIGGTLAWLTAKSEQVENTFSDSDININLNETGTTENKKEFEMVPGWTINKDPYVTVLADSEDCWLFVEVTESTNPALSNYIKYTVDQGAASTSEKTIDEKTVTVNHGGWTQGKGTEANGDGVPTNVYYRQVTASDADQVFAILGGGEYTDADTAKYTWNADQVLVRPEVTKEMMDAIDGDPTGEKQPTLSFKAYAVQLWKTNKPADLNNTDAVAAAQFSADVAWAKRPQPTTTTP